MSFITPQVLYLVPVVAVAVALLAATAARRRREKLRLLLGAGATDPDAVILSYWRRRLRVVLLALTLLALLVAAARPYWGSELVDRGFRGRDIIVIFDVSKSMLATDLAPSRLEHAKYLLRELVAAESGTSFGLVAFAGRAYLSCPLTADPTAFNQYIDELSTDSVPLGGTNLELALKCAETAFKSAPGGHRAIVVMTDGDELTGDSARAVAELKKADIPLLIVGLGNPDIGAPVPAEDGTMRRDRSGALVTTRLNEERLSQLALETGGIYVRSTVGNTGLAALEKRIGELGLTDREDGRRSVPVEKFPLALTAAAVFLLGFLLLGERPLRRSPLVALLCVLSCLPAAAGPGPEAAAADSGMAAVAASDQTPEELYNAARRQQLEGEAAAARLQYERVISHPEASGALQARSYHNLGVGVHTDARGELAAAVDALKQQNPDGALQQLTRSAETLNGARELYARGLALPEATENLEQTRTNLRQLEFDRRRIEELKRRIEELKKQQQQARQQTRQAQQQNQQDQQNQPGQSGQQDQQGQQGQSGQQNQPAPNADQAIDAARSAARELQRQAEALQQQSIRDAAAKAEQELDSAAEARRRQDREAAQRHLDEAARQLGGGSGEAESEGREPSSSGETGERGDKSSSAGESGQEGQDQSASGRDAESDSGTPDRKPSGGEPESEAKPDTSGAEQLLQLLNDEENRRRGELRGPGRARRPRVEKDW